MIISQSSHCGLVIMAELALYYERAGRTISEISQAHHIPEHILDPVLEKLCYAGFLRYESGSNNQIYFFLQRKYDAVCLWDIMQIFEQDFFSGSFLDEQSGKLMQSSHLTSLINRERKDVRKYLVSRFKKMMIWRLCDCVNAMQPVY